MLIIYYSGKATIHTLSVSITDLIIHQVYLCIHLVNERENKNIFFVSHWDISKFKGGGSKGAKDRGHISGTGGVGARGREGCYCGDFEIWAGNGWGGGGRSPHTVGNQTGVQYLCQGTCLCLCACVCVYA